MISLLRLLRLLKFAKFVWRRLARVNPKYIYHKRKMSKFYSQFINTGDLCFDIGANLGNRTEVFLGLGASVVAVEPQESCMQQLHKRYKDNDRVVLIQKALGSSEGQGEMMLSNSHTLSSMSKGWIESVKHSGRFPSCQWQERISVAITTLDKLIEKYGKPVFCKIDVEGFEYEVIRGLSSSFKFLSFEFTPEFIDSAIKAVKYFSELGKVVFNLSLGETTTFVLPEWIGSDEVCPILLSYQGKPFFGDVYCRFMD